LIIPSIDLISGNVVRLYQGKYNLKTCYNENVYDVVWKYFYEGAKIVHMVDLDGALNPNNKQTKLIKNLLNYFNFSIQIGGGIRSYRDVEMLLCNGAKRVVLGSSVINNFEGVKNWLSEFGGQSIVLALDICIHSSGYKEVVIDGWKNSSNLSLENAINQFSALGVQYVLCTDIKKDGTLLGPDVDLYKYISKLFKNINIQLSGGIGALNDIDKAKTSGVQDIIIGRALLEKKFSLSEAIQCWQNESFRV